MKLKRNERKPCIFDCPETLKSFIFFSAFFTSISLKFRNTIFSLTHNKSPAKTLEKFVFHKVKHSAKYLITSSLKSCKVVFSLQRWANTVKFSCFKSTVNYNWPNGTSASWYNLYFYFDREVKNYTFSKWWSLKNFTLIHYFHRVWIPFFDGHCFKWLHRPFSPQSSPYDLSQNTTSLGEIKSSLSSSNTSLEIGMQTHKASNSAHSLYFPERKIFFMNTSAFLTSNIMPPTPKSSSKPDINKDGSLAPQLSTKKLQFKHQLTSLYTISTPYKFQLNWNRYSDHWVPHVSKKLAI